MKQIESIINEIATAIDKGNLTDAKIILNSLKNKIEELLGGRWTYCSDEQPDEFDTYLILWRDEYTKRPYYEMQEYYEETGWEINIPQAVGSVEVIAWQKLPIIPEED